MLITQTNSLREFPTTLRRLQVFVHAVEAGSFRAAADRLGISECAVSHQISLLEDELGDRLFERRRGTSGVLTANGAAAFRHARTLLDHARELFDWMSGAGPRSREVRIIAEPALDHQLCPLVVRYAARHPEVSVSMACCSFEDAQVQIEAGAVDLFFYIDDRFVPEFYAQRAWQEPLGFFVVASHPLASAGHVTPEELRGIPMILPPPGSHVREVVIRELRRKGIDEVQPAPLLVSHEGVTREAVALGLGISACFRRTFEDEVRSGSVVELVVDNEFGPAVLDVWAGTAPRAAADPVIRGLRDFLLSSLASPASTGLAVAPVAAAA